MEGSRKLMALKDWKQTGNSVWRKEGYEDKIISVESTSRGNFPYHVFIRKGTLETTIFSKPFKSKAQAMTYAKSYMKRN